MLCIAGDEWMGGWMEVRTGSPMRMGLPTAAIPTYNRADGTSLVLQASWPHLWGLWRVVSYEKRSCLRASRLALCRPSSSLTVRVNGSVWRNESDSTGEFRLHSIWFTGLHLCGIQWTGSVSDEAPRPEGGPFAWMRSGAGVAP
jgi:hypothetical protein